METNELKQLHPKQLCCNEHSKTSLPDTFKHLFPWEMKATNLYTMRAIPKVCSSSPPQKSSAYTPPVSPPLCSLPDALYSQSVQIPFLSLVSSHSLMVSKTSYFPQPDQINTQFYLGREDRNQEKGFGKSLNGNSFTLLYCI